MKTRHLIVGVLLATVILASIQAATAFPSYLDVFDAKYGTTGTRLDTCGLCHVDPAGGGPRNSYGTAFEGQSGHSSNPSQAFSNIESLDSDGDGYSNFVEITARTFPGDASDHPAPAPVLTTITVTPSTASVTVGGTKTFTAAAKDQNGNPISTTVTWSSSNTTVGTINSAGVFAALAAGPTTISATSGSVSGTASVTVTAPTPTPTPILTTITVSPSTASLVVGNTQQFAAATKDQNGNSISATVTWSSSNTTVGTIDSTGKFTALVAGSATIKAASGTVSGTASVTVTALTPTPTPKLATITVSPSTSTLAVGGTYKFNATAKDQNGNLMMITLTWSSSNTTVGTVDSTGKFTALAAGHSTIMARSGSVNGTASVTVTASVVSSPPPSSNQTFTVTFVIVNAGTGRSVHDANVTLDGVSKETSRGGQVTFTNVTVGSHTYKVVVAGDDDDNGGYQQINGTINVTGNTVIQVKLTPIHEHESESASVRENDDRDDEDSS